MTEGITCSLYWDEPISLAKEIVMKHIANKWDEKWDENGNPTIGKLRMRVEQK